MTDVLISVHRVNSDHVWRWTSQAQTNIQQTWHWQRWV